MDAKCKIKAGRVSEHKTGKLIAPNNILIFTDLWHYVRAVLNQHLVSSSSHLQASGNEASGSMMANKLRSGSFHNYTNLWVSETWFHPLLLCMSLRHPSIIPTVKEWKECARIFNSDNCATACIYGAEKCYSPVAADGWGQFNGCLYSGRSH